MQNVDDPGRLRSLANTPPNPVAPVYRRGAPNVVVIVLDDLGFAQLGCYGCDLDTPNLDALAADGVRFTNFHTTAVCSPTRACLLTGRNHHRVGMGMLPDLPTNFPGYRGEFPNGAGTLAQILRADGYATYASASGTSCRATSASTGPFHMWPTGLGFERYYGFLNGETNQWTPNLIRDTAPHRATGHARRGLPPRRSISPTSHRATSTSCGSRNPSRPFLLWYASRRAACTAPGAAELDRPLPGPVRRRLGRVASRGARTPEAARHRARTHHAAATRPRGSSRGTRSTPPRQRLYARMMEVFAGVRRPTPTIRSAGCSTHLEPDRRASTTPSSCIVSATTGHRPRAGRTARGTSSVTTSPTTTTTSTTSSLTSTTSAASVRAATTRGGGRSPATRRSSCGSATRSKAAMRDPFIVSWPDGLAEHAGAVRDQYGHAVDVLPTLLDAARRRAARPSSVASRR